VNVNVEAGSPLMDLTWEVMLMIWIKSNGSLGAVEMCCEYKLCRAIFVEFVAAGCERLYIPNISMIRVVSIS